MRHGAMVRYLREKGGVEKIKGIDGSWLREMKPIINEKNIIYHNLENTQGLKMEKYDLAVSLEVAEHISLQHADDFVDF